MNAEKLRKAIDALDLHVDLPEDLIDPAVYTPLVEMGIKHELKFMLENLDVVPAVLWEAYVMWLKDGIEQGVINLSIYPKKDGTGLRVYLYESELGECVYEQETEDVILDEDRDTLLSYKAGLEKWLAQIDKALKEMPT